MPNKGKSATKRSGNTPHTGARRSQRVANNNSKNRTASTDTDIGKKSPTAHDNGKGGGGSPPA